jgi:hypothetical protein
MGPKGFKSIKGKLKEAGFDLHERQTRPADLKIYPEVEKKEDAVAFVEVSVCSSHSRISSLDILNALSSMVTLDELGKNGPTEGVTRTETLLYPAAIDTDRVRFLDLHHPNSQ